MRLELQSVEMKNFLSYGNSPQRLDFVEGINLIIGKNLGSGRSNGSGKCVNGSTMVEIFISDEVKNDMLTFLNRFSK